MFTNNIINTCNKCVPFKKFIVITKMPANIKQLGKIKFKAHINNRLNKKR